MTDLIVVPQPTQCHKLKALVLDSVSSPIIDHGTRAPLSESEGQKLKTALHAMAERLLPKRNTEKTSAMLPQDAAPAGKPDTVKSAPAGHGRRGAAAFTGANRVSIAHATIHADDRCSECREGKVYRQKEPATLVRFVGHAPLEATVFEMERLRCNAFTVAALRL